ncbi:MAG TPA: ketopantoate reductase family protein [Sphaerochaeta sp.]|nr:ketopantoate reductase family protein [Sphaerochaeta sp.]
MKKITIIGSGAVGAMYGLRLHQLLGKENVVFLADQRRRERYASEGLFLNGEKVDFAFVDPKDAKQSDLVIIATKNLQLEEAVHQIEHAVGDHTTILSLLNGIDSEEKLSEAYGGEHVLYGFAVGLNSTHVGNSIDFSKEGRIVFGEKDNSKSERVLAICSLFDRAHITYVVPEDIRLELWKKFMLNTAFNTLSALCRATYGDLKQESIKSLAWSVSKEVQAVGQKEGVVLPDAMIEQNYQIVTSLGFEGKTSMCQDMEAGRKTENNWFCSAVVRLGKKHAIATPTCELLSLLVEASEAVQIRLKASQGKHSS